MVVLARDCRCIRWIGRQQIACLEHETATELHELCQGILQLFRRCSGVTLAMALQVWNANACNAVVGAFNLQGSAWDRRKRQYITYNSKPPTLSAEIRVRDVPVFSSPATLVRLICKAFVNSCDTLLQH